MKPIIRRKYSRLAMMGLPTLVFTFSLLFAGISEYYFQDLLFNFGGNDSIRVNSLDYYGNDEGDQIQAYGMVIDPDGKYWFGFNFGFSNEIVKFPGDTVEKEVTPSVPESYFQNQVMTMPSSGVIVNNDGANYEFILTDMGLNCMQRAFFSTAVSEDIFIPYNLNLEQNYPNPFNLLITIHFTLEQSEKRYS